MKRLINSVLLSCLFVGYAVTATPDLVLVPQRIAQLVLDIKEAIDASGCPIEDAYCSSVCTSFDNNVRQVPFLDAFIGLSYLQEQLEKKELARELKDQAEQISEYLVSIAGTRSCNLQTGGCINNCPAPTNPCPPICPKCNNCVISDCFKVGTLSLSGTGPFQVTTTSGDVVATVVGAGATGVITVRLIDPFCSMMSVEVLGSTDTAPVSASVATNDTFQITNLSSPSDYQFVAVQIP